MAYDPDTGLNSIQTYTLITQSNPTETPPFRLIQEDAQLALIVQQRLDRESVPLYNLSIVACDGGASPSNCGRLRLLLNLADINDHSPVFDEETYAFSVAENLPAGTRVGQVTARDLDAAINGQVKYSLVESEQSPFRLDADSGVLTLSAPLDYESASSFSLSVEARDCGVGSMPAYASVEVRVSDVNDNAPEISVSFLNSMHRNYSASAISVYMSENAQPSQFIAHVSISDRDANENGQLSWRVYANDKVIASSDRLG